jgi:hypothetical protein
MSVYKKIIVIGDIRGDPNVLVKSLELSNLIKDNKWIGKDTLVIQMGNTLSGKSTTSPPLSKKYREASDEIKIFNLLSLFESQAKLHSCKIVSILGKHELLSYYHGNDYLFMRQYIKSKDEEIYKKMYNCSRNKFWKPGNQGGKLLSQRPLYILIDEILFTNFNLSTGEKEINKSKKDVEKWLQTGKNKPDIISTHMNNIDTKLNVNLLKLNCEKIITSNSIQNVNVINVKTDSSRAFGEETQSFEILEIITKPVLVIKRITENGCIIEL